jgi:hypothetical protein
MALPTADSPDAPLASNICILNRKTQRVLWYILDALQGNKWHPHVLFAVECVGTPCTRPASTTAMLSEGNAVSY